MNRRLKKICFKKKLEFLLRILIGIFARRYDLDTIDEINESSNFRVNTGVASTGASISPRNDSNLGASHGDWAAGISLAGILASLTGAEHDVTENVAGTVGISTFWKYKSASMFVPFFKALQTNFFFTAFSC